MKPAGKTIAGIKTANKAIDGNMKIRLTLCQ
jgi:hypothetical protein